MSTFPSCPFPFFVVHPIITQRRRHPIFDSYFRTLTIIDFAPSHTIVVFSQLISSLVQQKLHNRYSALLFRRLLFCLCFPLGLSTSSQPLFTAICASSAQYPLANPKPPRAGAATSAAPVPPPPLSPSSLTSFAQRPRPQASKVHHGVQL